MPVIKVQNFAGEVPRTPPRNLGDNAQVNSNLLATAMEFRPLADDATVAIAEANAKTLYRLARSAPGVLRSDDTSGWITSLQERSYVKGQLNDDPHERTCFTTDDGSVGPRVIQNDGSERPLGVPTPPAGPTVILTKVDEFTSDEADAYVADTLAKGATEKLLADIQDRRINTTGAIQATGLLQLQPEDEFERVAATAYVAGKMGSEFTGVVKIAAYPKWGLEVTTTLGPFLAGLTNPASTATPAPALLTTDEVTDLKTKLLGFFAVKQIEPDLKALESAVTAFKAVLVKLATATGPDAVGAVPKPDPSVTEYIYVEDAGEYRRNPAWADYDRYVADKDAQRTTLQDLEADTNGLIAEALRHQATAADLVLKIERVYALLRTSASQFVEATVYAMALFRAEGAVNGRTIQSAEVTDTRFYVYTHVTDRGEESAPSPVSTMIEPDKNDIVTITMPPPEPGYNVTHYRLYRSNVAANGAEFQYVPYYALDQTGARGAENTTGIPVGASGTTYRDTLKSEELGEVVSSTTWAMPPVRTDGDNRYLRGLVGMPNGIMAGFIDNFVAFCEPYRPYAWPVEYQITTDTPIVGLGVFGQSLFVGTLGNPYIMSGSDSATMSAQRLDVAQACVSRRSIVSLGGGVIYASPDGLVFVSSGGMDVISKGLFAREDWQKLNPASIVAVGFENVYYFTYTGSGGGAFALDLDAKKLARLNLSATAFFNDPTRDALFYVQGSAIKKAFSANRRTGKWRSGVFVFPLQQGFAWAQVDGDQSPATPAVLRWYGDGGLRHTATFTDTTPQRVPMGRWLEHEVEVESAARLTKAMLASSTQELQSA